MSGERADFSLSDLSKVKGITTPDGRKIEIKKEEKPKAEDELQEEAEESQEDELEEQAETEEVTEEEGEESDDDSEESEEESEEEIEESDESEEESEENEDSEESEEEDDQEDVEIQDSEEDQEEIESEEEDEEQDKEFNVYDFTDGVFESTEDLKRTSELLKANPELKEMLSFYEENGTLLPYLQATQVNVDEISDIDILRESFKLENADLNLSASEMEELFREDVLSRFPVNDEDESRSRIAKIRLKKESAKARSEMKKEQEKLRLPIERDAIKEFEESQKKAEQQLDNQKNKLGYQIRKEIKDGKIDIKLDDTNFVKMNVSPKKLTSMLKNLQSVDIFQDSKGNFDLRRMALAANPDAFISAVSQTFRAEGKKEFINDELKNRKPKGKKKVGVKKETPKKLDIYNMSKDDLKKVKIRRVGRN